MRFFSMVMCFRLLLANELATIQGLRYRDGSVLENKGKIRASDINSPVCRKKVFPEQGNY